MSLPVSAALSGTSVNLSSEFQYYHALGDSITRGYALASPLTQRYPALASAAISLPLTDNAVSGDQACDLPADQVIGKEAPALAARGMYTLLVSTNDVSVKGAGAYEAVFNACHQAVIAWLALPSEDKVLATDAAVTAAGAAHLEPFWNALTTDAAGASITFPVKTAAAGAVYVWYRITDGSTGAFTYAVDGMQMGASTSGTVPAMATYNGAHAAMALLRVPAVAAGSHSVTFTQTSVGTSGVGVIAVGTLPSAGTGNLPKVYVGTTPKQNSQTNAACARNDAVCQAYIRDIEANVALFAGDGLDVTLFDTRRYELGTNVDMIDEFHPNPLGHREIAQALYDAFAGR